MAAKAAASRQPFHYLVRNARRASTVLSQFVITGLFIGTTTGL
jgi:hypothetical protein